MRMVVDLGNLDHSTWVNQTGNSGHAFNDNYDDQVSAWAHNETFPWPSSEKAVRGAGGSELGWSRQGASETRPSAAVMTASTRRSCGSSGSGSSRTSHGWTRATRRAPGARGMARS